MIIFGLDSDKNCAYRPFVRKDVQKVMSVDLTEPMQIFN